MQLSDEETAEFIRIWFEEFGERLKPDAARLRASALIELYASLAEPIAEELKSEMQVL